MELGSRKHSSGGNVSCDFHSGKTILSTNLSSQKVKWLSVRPFSLVFADEKFVRIVCYGRISLLVLGDALTDECPAAAGNCSVLSLADNCALNLAVSSADTSAAAPLAGQHCVTTLAPDQLRVCRVQKN